MDNSDRHNCNNCIWADQCAGDAWPCEDFSPVDEAEADGAYYISTVRADIDDYYDAVAADE